MQNELLRKSQRNKLLDSSFLALFDKSPDVYNFELKYSGRFKDYNANVSYKGNAYTFNLSKEWRGVSNDIVVGVIQYLMLKAFSNSIGGNFKQTLNIDLYNTFLKQIHKYKAKTSVNSILKIIFDRVNEIYFLGLIECPNLVWGTFSKRTLGHYSYGSDTITISRIFENISEDDLCLLEFVMYHEMLHKKHKYTSSVSGRNLHHSSKFRFDERKFSNYAFVETKLSLFAGVVRKPVVKKVKSSIKGFRWF